jgi:hypothetical protein
MSLCLIYHHVMKTYVETNVKLDEALKWGSVLRSSRFTPSVPILQVA